MCIAILLIATSCNEQNGTHKNYSYSSSYSCDDTLSSFNLSLYARVSSSYKYNSLPIIILVTTPLGAKYSDTLQLSFSGSRVESKKVQSGIWQDYEWKYRKNIVFNNKGKWTFIIKQDTSIIKQNSLLPILKEIGQMGVKISKS